MKINNLQVEVSDLINDKLIGYDLCCSFNKLGISSKYIAKTKKINDSNTCGLMQDSTQEYHNFMFGLNQQFMVQSLLYQFSYELLFNQYFLNADIVHYHFDNETFLNFIHLPILTKLKPTVWTLHDDMILECDGGMYANSKFKEIAIQNSDFDIIVTSQRMLNKVLSSLYFKDKKIHLISNGVNLGIFKPDDKRKLRENLGIQLNNFVVYLYITNMEAKELGYTKDLLKLLESTKNITIITNGEVGLLANFKNSFQVVELGYVQEESERSSIYAAADVFVSTSLIESFCCFAIESMASGTPVLAFAGEEISEIIEAPKCGIIVPPTDVCTLKGELIDLMLNREKLNQLAVNARKLAEKKYNKIDYMKRIIDLYKEIIDRRGFDARSNFIVQQQQDILIKRQKALTEIMTHNNPVTQNVSGDIIIDMAIINSRIYQTLIKLREKKVPRIIYFKIARPTFRFLKRVRNYVRK